MRARAIPAAMPAPTRSRAAPARVAGTVPRDNRTARVRTLLLALLLQQATSFSSEVLAQAAPPVSCEHEIATAARRYDIPLAVFYAVGLNETGVRGRLQPYSMNIDGRASSNGSLEEAMSRFKAAKIAGARMIDIGCMQINHPLPFGEQLRLARARCSIRRLNVDYAARFLRELKQRERTWTMAVARYNAGPNNDPAQRKYVCGVLTKMVASGFGAWTESARNFCFVAPVAKPPL